MTSHAALFKFETKSADVLAVPMIERLVEVAFVKVANDEKKFVDVALVEVDVSVVRLMIVEEADARRPFVNVRSVEVAFPGNGYANVGSPREEVAVSVYVPPAFPTRSCPKVGALVSPVPP